MNPEVKRVWVAALRKGTVGQARSRLRRLVGTRGSSPAYNYCCLGMLCNILEPKGWTDDSPSWWQNVKGHVFHGGGDAMPSSVVRQKAGLGNYEAGVLARLNDRGTVKKDSAEREGKSFSQIADWIETNL